MRGSFMAKVALERGMVTLLMAAPTTPMMVLAFSRGFLLSFSTRTLACSRALIGYNTGFLSSVLFVLCMYVVIFTCSAS